MRPLPPGVTDPTPTRVGIPLPAVPARLPARPTPGRAVLRQTLYALTRTVGDLPVGTMIAPLTRDGHPDLYAPFTVEDGRGHRADVARGDVALVSGLAVLADHTDGRAIAFGRWTNETHARAFAARLMAADLPDVAGVWVGEVIRQD